MEQTGNTILSMQGIVKEYNVAGEVSQVLKGIDLTVEAGEFLAVLGPSGSGKSTLMNIIWFFIGGIWIFLSHIFWGVLFCITIIGIPFGMQHFKLAGLALTPFGHDVK